MRKLRVILLVSVILVVVELTGIPSVWKNRTALVGSLIIVGTALLLNREIRIAGISEGGETVTNMYVDNGPRMNA